MLQILIRYDELLGIANQNAINILEEGRIKNKNPLSLYERLCTHAKSIARENAENVFRQNHPLIFKILQFYGLLDLLVYPSVSDINLAKSALIKQIKVITQKNPSNDKVIKTFYNIFSIIDEASFPNLTPDQAIKEIFKNEFNLTNYQDHEIDLLIYNQINENQIIANKNNDSLKYKISQKLISETTFEQRENALEEISNKLRNINENELIEYLNNIHQEKRTLFLKKCFNEAESATDFNSITSKFKNENNEFNLEYFQSVLLESHSEKLDPVERFFDVLEPFASIDEQTYKTINDKFSSNEIVFPTRECNIKSRGNNILYSYTDGNPYYLERDHLEEGIED